MTQGAAIRRRKQWAHGHKHLPPLRRPIYHQTSEAKRAKRLAQWLEKQRAMMGRKKK
jgi:hypothetical protein